MTLLARETSSAAASWGNVVSTPSLCCRPPPILASRRLPLTCTAPGVTNREIFAPALRGIGQESSDFTFVFEALGGGQLECDPTVNAGLYRGRIDISGTANDVTFAAGEGEDRLHFGIIVRVARGVTVKS